MLDGKYRTEGYYKSKKIIVDLADIGGKYEVIAMTKNGLDLACETYHKLAEAIDAYHKMVETYIQATEKPLSGKYAKLRDDLKKALEVGKAAELADPEDGGACNFDSAAIYLPRWREALVKQAAKEAGTSCFDWSLYGYKHFVFRPDTKGQGNARSRNAEAMTKCLENLGYDVFEYCQMD